LKGLEILKGLVMTANIEEAINHAAHLGARLEHLVYNKSQEGKLVFVGKDDDLLMAYWSLVFDYNKGVGCLLHNEFYSAAFALLRPTVEAVVRAGVVLAGTPEDVQKIRKDNYAVNFKKDGAWIDKALDSGTLMDDFLKGTRELLHSLTHSGAAQLGMRFDGDEIGAFVSDIQLAALLGATSGAAFLMTIVVAKHFNFGDVANDANKLFWEYGQQSIASAGEKLP
jgi:hypothetical protein